MKPAFISGGQVSVELWITSEGAQDGSGNLQLMCLLQNCQKMQHPVSRMLLQPHGLSHSFVCGSMGDSDEMSKVRHGHMWVIVENVLDGIQDGSSEHRGPASPWLVINGLHTSLETFIPVSD